MKKITTFIVMMMMALCSTTVSAQELVQYTSSAFGLTLPVPSNCEEVQDNEEATMLKTPDDQYVFTAIPMEADQYTEDVVITLAEAANIDINNSTRYNMESDVLAGAILAQQMENGTVSCTGAAQVVGTNLVFAITFVGSEAYMDYVIAGLKGITIHPEVLKQLNK